MKQQIVFVLRSVVLLLFFVGAMHVAPAQYLCHKIWDNWSVGIQAGGVSPIKHHAMINDARTVVGWHVAKQLIPTFGFELQTTLGVNTSGVHAKGSANTIDDIHSSLLMRLSVTNLFYGYVGQRTFEMEAVYGFGHQHHYYPASQAEDRAHFTSTAGMNFNFRLGEQKAWGLSVRPHVVWNLERQAYTVNAADFRLTLGMTYYFKSSNGKHYITRAKLYDQPQVDALKAKVNDLRQMVRERDEEIRRLKKIVGEE